MLGAVAVLSLLVVAVSLANTDLALLHFLVSTFLLNFNRKEELFHPSV